MNDGIQVLCTNLFNYLSNMPVSAFKKTEIMYMMGAGFPSWTSQDYQNMVSIYKRIHNKPPDAFIDPDESERNYEQDISDDFEPPDDPYDEYDDDDDDDYDDWMKGND